MSFNQFKLVEKRITVHAPVGLTDAESEELIDRLEEVFDDVIEGLVESSRLNFPNLTFTVTY